MSDQKWAVPVFDAVLPYRAKDKHISPVASSIVKQGNSSEDCIGEAEKDREKENKCEKTICAVNISAENVVKVEKEKESSNAANRVASPANQSFSNISPTFSFSSDSPILNSARNLNADLASVPTTDYITKYSNSPEQENLKNFRDRTPRMNSKLTFTPIAQTPDRALVSSSITPLEAVLPSPAFVSAILSENTKLREREARLAQVTAEANALRESLQNVLGVVELRDKELQQVKTDMQRMQQEFETALASPLALSSYRSSMSLSPQDSSPITPQVYTNSDLSPSSNQDLGAPYSAGGRTPLVRPPPISTAPHASKPMMLATGQETSIDQLSPSSSFAAAAEAISNHLGQPDALQIAKRRLLSFEVNEVPKYEEAYLIMRRLIPLGNRIPVSLCCYLLSPFNLRI